MKKIRFFSINDVSGRFRWLIFFFGIMSKINDWNILVFQVDSLKISLFVVKKVNYLYI